MLPYLWEYRGRVLLALIFLVAAKFANVNGVASGRIYNVGNPANHHSVRELAEMMLALAAELAVAKNAGELRFSKKNPSFTELVGV